MTEIKPTQIQLTAIQELFSFVPPKQLHKTITELFYTWLVESPSLPENYKQMTEDVVFLLNFLEDEEKCKV
jgi:hypothetical protein